MYHLQRSQQLPQLRRFFTAFTVSLRDPREIYPIAFSSPATVVIITEVLFVMLASTVVISIFSPSFSSWMPNSSIKAPLVPEPSSREITLIVPLAALATVANAVVPITAAAKIPTIFFLHDKSPLFYK